MKNIHFLSIVMSVLLLFSCKKNDDYVLVGKPIIKSLADIRADIKVISARATNSDGKIYVAGNYLYYIAQKSGVHIFDNTNPASPKNIAFIKLQGVHDIAIKGNYLFADNYSDLVVLNISNLANVQIVKFVENSIPYYAENTNDFTDIAYFDYPNVDMSDKVIVGYEKVREKNKFDNHNGPIMFEDMTMMNSTASSSNVGIGGSYARFQINNNALYTVDDYTLKVFNISNPSNTKFVTNVYMNSWIGGRLETLFRQGDNLFVGSTAGVHILDASDEFNPTYKGVFSHATSCDPVVVNGNTAYVTLRGGTNCNATIQDQVNVLDVSDLTNPHLLSTYFMNQPLGVGVHNSTLFVCSGDNNLYVFDANNSSNLLLKNKYAIQDVLDVIPLNSHLIVVGKDKIVQYNYGNNYSLEAISTVNF